MREQEIRLEKLTRREFRTALAAEHYQVAILPTGSIEQHLEHLALEQDIVSSTYVAEQVAERLYPNVIVAVPMAIGIAEHHMGFAGTLSARPGSWLAVLFDAVESLVRHGVRKVLIINGHGGNVAVIRSALPQWQLYFRNAHVEKPEFGDEVAGFSHGDYNRRVQEAAQAPVDLRSCSYWDLIPRDFANEVLETGSMPGHAQEFETAVTMYAFPENLRPEAMAYNTSPNSAKATSEKGRVLIGQAIEGGIALVQEMLAEPQP